MNGLNQCEESSIIDALQNGNEEEQNAAIQCIIQNCFPITIVIK